jgi:hypothetical protein
MAVIWSQRANRSISSNVNNEARDLIFPKLFENRSQLKCIARKKIFFFHAMGEKRKLSFWEDEWITGKVKSGEEVRGRAYLAAFSGVVPPEETTFRQYERKNAGAADDATTREDFILQGETERIEFVGHTQVQDTDDFSQ